MKSIIVYFPYALKEGKSGSAVRPKKMLEAFDQFGSENNINIIKIYGNSHERKKKLKQLYKEINPTDILFCYMENSTLPFWLTDSDHIPRKPLLEIKFFNYLKNNSIPSGIFYRDVYWMFEDYPLKGVKRSVMKFVYKLELKILKEKIDKLFLPSYKMNDFVKFDQSNIEELPPGGDNKKIYNNKNSTHAIYVGGINNDLGLYNLLKSFKIINNEWGYNKKLFLVCREEDYILNKDLLNEYLLYNWLQIEHAHDEQLDALYYKSDIGIIPRKKTAYNDFAVPVKLFEYLSYGLPIVATNCDAQARIIENDDLGLVADDTPDDLANKIALLLNESNLMYYKNNVEKALQKNHFWIHRVEKIFNDLIGEK